MIVDWARRKQRGFLQTRIIFKKMEVGASGSLSLSSFSLSKRSSIIVPNFNNCFLNIQDQGGLAIVSNAPFIHSWIYSCNVTTLIYCFTLTLNNSYSIVFNMLHGSCAMDDWSALSFMKLTIQRWISSFEKSVRSSNYVSHETIIIPHLDFIWPLVNSMESDIGGGPLSWWYMLPS